MKTEFYKYILWILICKHIKYWLSRFNDEVKEISHNSDIW